VRRPAIRLPKPSTVRLVTDRFVISPLVFVKADELFGVVDGSRSFLLPYMPEVGDWNAPNDLDDVIASGWDDSSDFAARFAVRDAGTKLLLGSVGLETESGYGAPHEHVAYWRRADTSEGHVMREAVGAVVGWAFSVLQLEELRSYVSPKNEASIKVLQSTGFSRIGPLQRSDGKKEDGYRKVRPRVLGGR